MHLKNMQVLIKYEVIENDSDWMSSTCLEQEEHKVNIQKKEDVINFLKSLDYVSLNEDIMKELESDNDFTLDNQLNKLYTDSDTHGWVSTDYRLSIKAIL